MSNVQGGVEGHVIVMGGIRGSIEGGINGGIEVSCECHSRTVSRTSKAYDCLSLTASL